MFTKNISYLVIFNVMNLAQTTNKHTLTMCENCFPTILCHMMTHLSHITMKCRRGRPSHSQAGILRACPCGTRVQVHADIKSTMQTDAVGIDRKAFSLCGSATDYTKTKSRRGRCRKSQRTQASKTRERSLQSCQVPS